jgi:glutamate synthase domain-containing protein 2
MQQKTPARTGISTHNKKLQAGLDPEDKAEQVRNYVQNMVREIGVIAHSCGVREPRQLHRHHARILTADARSVPLDGLYPEHSPIVQPLASQSQ